MAFPWAFCSSPFRQLLSEISAVLFSHSAAVHAQPWQPHNSCPLPTMLRYVKPMPSVWVHLSFALTLLLRTSRNLDCNKTPRLQNKIHNLVNSNHSKKSNPMMTDSALKQWHEPILWGSHQRPRNCYEMHSNYFVISYDQASKMETSQFCYGSIHVHIKFNLNIAKCKNNTLLFSKITSKFL